MSNIHQIDQHSTLKKEQLDVEEKRLGEASDWIAKLDRSLTNDEKIALQTWLALTKKNRDVLFEVAQIWDKMDDLSRLSDLFPDL